ncbi:hypothetical protein Barb4_02218 [Bacteroidales bacterium Barb4]|nr:hypothetical protein Barb4_02218 [Bacteroidales bacterium Barb4]
MSHKRFAEYAKLDLAAVNKEILKKWKDENIFRKSMEIRKGKPMKLSTILNFL